MRRTIRVPMIAIAVLAASGCAGVLSRWQCAGASCAPYDQAANRCLAQANAAFTRYKSTIWSQCMRGEGFERVPCERGTPGCRLLHVM